MIEIVGYQKKWFPLFADWWEKAKETVPLPEMLPEDTTFVAVLNERPVAVITLYTTNCKYFAMLEGLVADPIAGKSVRREAVEALVQAAVNFAKHHGYRHLYCLSKHPKLTARYEELGFPKTLDATCHLKEVL